MPLASPASHDTATFTVAGVPSAMLFVRNANGSHNPHEAMEIDDFLEGACVLTGWLIGEASSTSTCTLHSDAYPEGEGTPARGQSASNRVQPRLGTDEIRRGKTLAKSSESSLSCGRYLSASRLGS